MPQTAQSLGVSNPYNPKEAIPAAAKLLRQSLNSNGNDYTDALRQYQGGPNKSKWGPQNAAYVGKVMSAFQQYGGTPEMLAQNGEGDPDAAINSFVGNEAKTLGGGGQNEGQGGAAASGGATPATSPAPSQTPSLSPAQAAQLGQIEAGNIGGTQSPPSTSAPNAQGAPQSPSSLVPTTGAEPPGWQGAQTQPQGPPVGQALDSTSYDVPSALVRSMTLGASPYVGAALHAGYDALTGQSGMPIGQEYNALLNQDQAAFQQWQQEHPGQALASNVLGQVPPAIAGTSLAGNAARVGGSLIGRAIPAAQGLIDTGEGILSGTAGSNFFERGASRIASGAAQGATAAAINSGQNRGSLGDQVGTGAAIGGALNPILGPIGSTIVPKVGEYAGQVAGLAQKYGIDLPTGALARGTAIARMAGSGGDAPLRQFSDAVGQQIGLKTGTPLTISSVEAAQNAAGADLSRYAGQTGIRFNSADGQATINMLNNLRAAVPTDDPAYKRVVNVVQQLRQQVAANNGSISGERYQALTQRNGPIDGLIRDAYGPVSAAGSELRGIIDDALERTANLRGNPQAVTGIQTARGQYRDSLALENLAAKTGEHGVIDPVAFANKFGAAANPAFRDLSTIGRQLPRPDMNGSPSEGSSFGIPNAMIRHAGEQLWLVFRVLLHWGLLAAFFLLGQELEQKWEPRLFSIATFIGMPFWELVLALKLLLLLVVCLFL